MTCWRGSLSEIFHGNDQQDVAEALDALLSMCHEACVAQMQRALGEDCITYESAVRLELGLGQFRTVSSDITLPIVNHFGAMQRSSVYCNNCQHVTTNINFIYQLIVPIPREGQVTLQACVDASERWEFLVDKDDHCEHCNFGICRFKKLRNEVWPKVLVVSIKRGVDKHGKKDARHVPYDLELQLSQNADVKYELRAVLVHAGRSAAGGHYYGYGRFNADDWHCFNDEAVESSSAEHALQQQASVLIYSALE